MKSSFDTLYKKLNAAQREAVDTIYGPVVVVAGPGTGKTSVLTLRIANILKKTDTPPDAILALTFTEAGVQAMRTKLLEIMGPRAYEVRLYTFHSFANDLIKRYPEYFARIVGAEHMEDIEQIKIVEELIARHASVALRPKNNPSYYVLPVIDAMKNLKREHLSPREFAAWLKKNREDKNKERNKELAKLYRAYERKLARHHLYDFEDMVGEAVRALEEYPEFKAALQEEYQFILADEHQDANGAQNRLLELLCDYDDAPNLFIVGDDKQAIFRFQGASLENFLYFQKRFPTGRVITLTDNYRSQPTILVAAHGLMLHAAPLTARAAHPPAALRVAEAPDEAGALAHLVQEAEALIRAGTPAEEIAVLARENREAERAERALAHAGIRVSRRGTSNVLDSARLGAFRAFLAAVCEPERDELLAPILFFYFLNLPLLSVYEALRPPQSGQKVRRPLLFRLSEQGTELAAFQRRLLGWTRRAKNDSLMESIDTLAHESGFLETLLLAPDADEALREYDAFLQAAERFAERNKRAKLADFVERLARAEAHGVGIARSDDRTPGLQVLTAHKAKGLEFDHVFILFAHDRSWGGRRNRAIFSLPATGGEGDAVSDERRLFFVAATRARKTLSIVWCARGEAGRSLAPVRFIFEMPEHTREHIKQNSFSGTPCSGHTDFLGRKSARFRAAALKRPVHKVHPQRILQDRDYLNRLFLEQAFAVTHLNNFLECPLKYFFLNLVRVPRAQSGAELYGSAVHTALAAHFRSYAREETRPLRETLRIFEGTLRRTHLAERDFKAYFAAGKRELKGYLASQAFPRASWSEFAIGGIMLPVGKEEIELTGKLDRVALLPGGGVAVVDYKTGSPKTRNELLGKTKDADGNYYRQLIFYKLLLDEYKKSDWNMKYGAIDFLKPDKNGKFRREIFEITDAEVRTLKTQIADVAAQILTLSFFGDGCGEKGCAWCRLYRGCSREL